jgi:isochorismate hydrolase
VFVEQEVKLNTPGQDDGVLRMWVDGQLKVQNLGTNLRGRPETALTGVVSDIGYARGSSDAVAIKVSPFMVQSQ